MNYFLNANETETNTTESTKTYHFQDLINNITQLDIREDSLLPKIVLTDCSTYYTPDSQESAVSTSSLVSNDKTNVTIKKPKLDFGHVGNSTENHVIAKSAGNQRSINTIISKITTDTEELTNKVFKLDLVSSKDFEDFTLKSPKSSIAVRLPNQTSLNSSVEVEDRKTLREALYHGIFHRHRRTIFAVGSFLRMLRSRNSQYNTIRNSSEGEDIDEIT